ncbi:unnamed protein product [Cylicostephanus goldi]|uniref:Uncharacterized protein n=1 Tax=Cylicostephanus goldi TaxID=71465 RepID=A0A3P6RE19_CYLGO|nr:unnamed protein product [Cylicostephanus goldi]
MVMPGLGVAVVIVVVVVVVVALRMSADDRSRWSPVHSSVGATDYRVIEQVLGFSLKIAMVFCFVVGYVVRFHYIFARTGLFLLMNYSPLRGSLVAHLL